MTPTGDGKSLVMTYQRGIYSFHCKSRTNCYWNTTEYELEISREAHIMMTIPSSLVENCDCELNFNENCRCGTGIIGDDCDQCKDGYWGFDQEDHIGCESEF